MTDVHTFTNRALSLCLRSEFASNAHQLQYTSTITSTRAIKRSAGAAHKDGFGISL
jgi:hypothetical protein